MHKGISAAMVLAAVIILLFPFFSYAQEVKEVIAEGEYIMGDGETMSIAEERAQKNAARNAAEQAGAFVKSYTEVKNMALRSDVIEVVANHAMKISVLKKYREMMGNAVRCYVKIKAVMSTKDIDDNLKKLQNDSSIVDAYKKLQADFDRQARDVESLKKQLAGATGGEKKAILAKISNDERLFKANLWLEEGQKQNFPSDKNDWQRRIDAYTKAIELNPDQVQAYIGRGDLLHQYNEAWQLDTDKLLDKAFSDYNRAIELDPQNPWIYYGRSQALDSWAQAERRKNPAISDLSAKLERFAEKAEKEKRKPNKREIKWLLEFKAAMHRVDDKYLSRALQDIDRAVSLKPDEPRFYAARANFYEYADDCCFKSYLNGGNKASCDRAISDMTKAIALASALPDRFSYNWLYMRRSFLYRFNGSDELANKDWKEFKRLDSLREVERDLPVGYIVDEKAIKDCESKIKTLDQAISEDPDNPLNYLKKSRELSTVALYRSERGQNIKEIDAERIKNMNRAIDMMEKKGAEKSGRDLISAYYTRFQEYRFPLPGNERPYDSDIRDLSRIIELHDVIYREELRAYQAASAADLRKSMHDKVEKLREAGEEDEAVILGSKVSYLDVYLKDALIDRARIFEKLGLPEKAQADYAKACSGWSNDEACKALRRLK